MPAGRVSLFRASQSLGEVMKHQHARMTKVLIAVSAVAVLSAQPAEPDAGWRVYFGNLHAHEEEVCAGFLPMCRRVFPTTRPSFDARWLRSRARCRWRWAQLVGRVSQLAGAVVGALGPHYAVSPSLMAGGRGGRRFDSVTSGLPRLQL